MGMGSGWIVILVMMISIIAGCDQLSNLSKAKSWPAQGPVAASVNNLPISVDQLEQEIVSYNEMAENVESKIITREQKTAYLNDELVRRYLLYIEAKKRGMDKQPKTQELLRNLEINVLAGQLLRSEIENITVSDGEVEEFYNSYKEQYRQEEERKIREIVLEKNSL